MAMAFLDSKNYKTILSHIFEDLIEGLEPIRPPQPPKKPTFENSENLTEIFLENFWGVRGGFLICNPSK